MKFISKKDVTAKTGLSPSALDRREKAGTFPKRILLAANKAVWPLEEIDAWMAEVAAGRGADA